MAKKFLKRFDCKKLIHGWRHYGSGKVICPWQATIVADIDTISSRNGSVFEKYGYILHSGARYHLYRSVGLCQLLHECDRQLLNRQRVFTTELYLDRN